MNTHKGFSTILIIVVGFVIIGVGATFYYIDSKPYKKETFPELLDDGDFLRDSAEEQGLWYEETLRKTLEKAEMKKISEAITCNRDHPQKCYKAKCNTGYIYLDPFYDLNEKYYHMCTDGSPVQVMYEVPKDEYVQPVND